MVSNFVIRIIVVFFFAHLLTLLIAWPFSEFGSVFRWARVFEWSDVRCAWVLSLARWCSRAKHRHLHCIFLLINSGVNFHAQRIDLVASFIERDRVESILLHRWLHLRFHKWKCVLHCWWRFVWCKVLIMEGIKHASHFWSVACVGLVRILLSILF